jgi:hypothetical protein
MTTIDKIPLFTEVNKEESAVVCGGGIKADFDKENKTVILTLDDGQTIKYYYGRPVWEPLGNLSGFFSIPMY